MDISPDSTILPMRTAMTVGAVTALLMIAVAAIPGLAQAGHFIIFAGGTYYGMKRFRTENGGCIGYAKVTFAGIQTAFFVSLILAFFVYAILKAIDPSQIDLFRKVFEQRVQALDMPSEIAASYMQLAGEMLTPGFIAIMTVVIYSVSGAITAVICGAFLKNVPLLNHN